MATVITATAALPASIPAFPASTAASALPLARMLMAPHRQERCLSPYRTGTHTQGTAAAAGGGILRCLWHTGIDARVRMRSKAVNC